MNAVEALAGIAAGKVLYIATALRITRIDQRTVLRWRKAGFEVLKDGADGHLLLGSGRKYVDTHWARVEFKDA